jgi:hypothetical protein
MDYMLKGCPSQIDTKKNNKKNNKKKNGKKKNNKVKLLGQNSIDKNLKLIKQYLPETPNIFLEIKETEVPDITMDIIDCETNSLEKCFQEITFSNTDTAEKSGIPIRKYNVTNNTIDISNQDEYNLIVQFLKEAELPDLDNLPFELESSLLGRLIMEGYRRYIKKDRYITLNFHQVFQKCYDNKNKWYYGDDTHKNIMICFQKLEGEYLDIIDDRYNYIGCLIIGITEDKSYFRLPIYLDKNSQIGFPSMRKINKHYFTIYNISMNKDLFLDYDLDNNELCLITDEEKDLVRYSLSRKGISFHYPFSDYLNTEYLEEINKNENKYMEK